MQPTTLPQVLPVCAMPGKLGTYLFGEGRVAPMAGANDVPCWSFKRAKRPRARSYVRPAARASAARRDYRDVRHPAQTFIAVISSQQTPLSTPSTPPGTAAARP
jgi:hypothetical protein